MATRKLPEYYNAPLKSRQDISNYFYNHQSYYRHNDRCSPVAWNVKLLGLNLKFDNLIRRYKESGFYPPDDPRINNPQFVAHAQKIYNNLNSSALYENAVEMARSYVLHSNGDDAHKYLWNGTQRYL